MKQTNLLSIFLIVFSIATINSQSLYWSTHDQIRTSKLDNTLGEVVLSGNILECMRLDKINQKIYWSDSKSSAFYSVNYDGSDVKLLISEIEKPHGFCLMGGFIYLIVDKSIRKYDLDGKLIGTVIDNLDGPLELEGDDGLLFWTDHKSGKIEKIAEDGTGRDTLLSNFSGPCEIEINSTDNYLIYSIGSQDANIGLYKIKYDGSNKEKLASLYFVNISYDEESKDIYWLTEFGISKSPINGAFLETSIEPKPDHYPQLRVDSERNKLFMAPYYGDRIIIKTELNQNILSEIVVRNKLYSSYLISPDPTNSSLFYTSGNIELNGISKAFIGKVDIETNIPGVMVDEPKLAKVVSARYDIIGNKFYWFEYTNGKFYYSNPDGSNISEIIETMDDVHSFDIDPLNERIIWHDNEKGSFYSCNIHGQDLQLLKSQVPFVGELNFSQKTRNLFYIDFKSQTIRSLDLNSGIITTITGDPVNAPIRLTLDDKAGKLYFTKNNMDNRLWQVNYDGDSLKSLAIDDLDAGADLLIVYDKKSLSREVIDKDTIRVYPSPFTNSIFIKNAANIKSINLLDVMGNIIRSENVESSEIFELNNLNQAVGANFLRIVLNSGTIKTIKLIRAQ